MTRLRKPQYAALSEAPAEGDAVVLTISPVREGEFPVTLSCALLGPGRDYDTRTDAEAAYRHINRLGHIRVTVSEVYSTISALVHDYPGAKLDSTAKRMLAAERAREQYAEAVADWYRQLDAAGLEPCERCGGDGGWQGWPGWTCYRCDGDGTEPRRADETAVQS